MTHQHETIQRIEFTPNGLAYFNSFFDEFAKPGVDRDIIACAVLRIMVDRVAARESLMYELPPQFTVTGRPECLMLDVDDLLAIHA